MSGMSSTPLPERRDVDRDDAEAVVEVVAEAARPDRVDEVDVRGGDDAGVHRAGRALADPLEAPLLEDAEELDLEVERHVAHLVEEDRPPLRHVEAPDPVADGAGEGAAHVAEELALEELARERPAVHRDEGAGAAGGVRVEGAGDELLAGAALARHEDRRLAPVERLDEVDDPEHDGGAGDEAVRGEHRLDEAVVGLGGPDDDDVAGPRVAVARDVGREDGRRQRDEPGAPLAAAEDRPAPLLPEALLERLAEGVGRAEEPRADELLDRAPHGRCGGARARRGRRGCGSPG